MTTDSRLARLINEAGLTSKQVAIKLHVSIHAVSKWVRGESYPQPDTAIALATLLGKDSPAQLFFDPIPTQQNGLPMVIDILGSGDYDRRQIIEMLATLPAFAGIDLSVLLSEQSIKPEQFLTGATATIAGCWELMDSGGYATVGAILNTHMPTLQSLTLHASKHQEDAAGLATQCKIMQMQLASRNRDFASRRAFGREAVQFAEISGDRGLVGAALYWHGDTFVYCYQQPEKAIPLLERALSHIDAPAILMNLGIAHAQTGNEVSALSCMERAREAKPDQNVILDREAIPGDLEKLEGRLYLDLSSRIKSYAHRAYDVFGESADRYRHQGGLSQTLIHKADAARLIEDLDEYARCLQQGTLIALQRGGPNRQHQAMTVFKKAPQAWLKEPAYQRLAPLFQAHKALP